MQFEWSKDKEQRIRRKHGVSFADACKVFDDPCALMLQDRFEGGEERWQAIGRAGVSLVVVVAHTYRVEDGSETIRIISARRALRVETSKYEDQAY